jgi:hypothetical protein
MKRQLKIRINGWLHYIFIDTYSNGTELTDKELDKAIIEMLNSLNAKIEK